MGVMKHKTFAVYIMASWRNGTLYVGVTSDLLKRVHQHKEGTYDGFTKKYSVNRLVWYEIHDNAEAAITREKHMKAWKRIWKIRVIEEKNPEWMDLYLTLTGSQPKPVLAEAGAGMTL